MSTPDDQLANHAAGPTGEVAAPPHPIPQQYRTVVSAIMLVVVVFLFFLFAWWLQDVAAPYLNEGEADITQTVTFDAEGGSYRVITSGPTRPAAINTACLVTGSDGNEQRILAGDGSVTPQDRFGVSRVIEFEVPAGPTSVTCFDLKIETADGGRFQVVEAGGLQQIGLIAGGLIALLAVVSLVTTVVSRLRRRRVAT